MTNATRKSPKIVDARPLGTVLDEVFAAANRSDAPGVVVGVAHRGSLLYRRGFGLASVALGVANTPRTRMRIGSTSKQFTCLAIMLLAEDGKLDIDASVRRYLPELSTLSPEPTLRQFMNHTSGWRCYLDVGFIADGNVIQPKGSALAAQVRQRGVNFAPGDKMMYCNGGFHLLSIVVDRVAGMPYEAFLKQRIFEPLGMVDTDSVPSDFTIVPGAATLHVALGDGRYRLGVFPSEEVRGEGAMISTVDDMLRWIAHLRAPAKTVGSTETWAAMLTLTTLNDGSANPYGFGLFRHDYRGVEVVHHAGGVIGGSCQMITVPSHELDVIIINNGAAISVDEAAKKVIDTVIGDAVLGKGRDIPKASQFKPMVGSRYFSKVSGFQIGFTDVEGNLRLSVVNNDGMPLHRTKKALVVGFEDVAFGPLSIDIDALATEGTAPETLICSEAGNPETYLKLPEQPPALKKAAASLLGRYHSGDLAAEARIEFEGDKLMLRVLGKAGTGEMELEPYSDDVFGCKSTDPYLPLRSVLSVTRERKAVTGLRISTGRTRQLSFDRLPV